MVCNEGCPDGCASNVSIEPVLAGPGYVLPEGSFQDRCFQPQTSSASITQKAQEVVIAIVADGPDNHLVSIFRRVQARHSRREIDLLIFYGKVKVHHSPPPAIKGAKSNKCAMEDDKDCVVSALLSASQGTYIR